MIYHIASRKDWEAAGFSGSYSAASLDSEGFIHCSSRDQVLTVADSFFRGQRELVLLCMDETALTAELKWEAAAHPSQGLAAVAGPGERFPHLYGSVNVEAVVAVFEFNEGEDGFALPSKLPG